MNHLRTILLNIEPTGLISQIIHDEIRTGDFEKVVSMLKDQSKDAPEELKKVIGLEAFQLIINQNQAA